MSTLQLFPSFGRMEGQSWQHHTDSLPRGILIVDDDEMVRTLLGLYFRQQGIPVWLASDGDEALELYQSVHEHVGVVLIDADMPGCDGHTTLARLQQFGAEVACYLMIEQPTAPSALSSRPEAAAGLIVKPFFFKVLARTIQQNLHEAQAMVDLNAMDRFARPYLRQVFGDLVHSCSH